MPSFHFLPLNPRQHPIPKGRRARPGARPRSEVGQSLAILAIMMLALLAFVGLAADGAVLYVTYGQLRRSVDAAALAVASQLREVRSQDELERSAEEVMRLQGLVRMGSIGADEAITDNGLDDDGDGCVDDPVRACGVQIGNTDEVGPQASDGLDNDSDGCVDDPARVCIRVERCEELYSRVPDMANGGFIDPLVTTDPAICTFPARKLARVEASTSAEFTFMRLWGWNRVQLDAEAVGEAAALDVMLVLDLSYSMTWDASLSNGFDDDRDGCVDENDASCQSDSVDNDGDTCVDELPNAPAPCDALPEAYPDDWLGAPPPSGNGKVRSDTVDNSPFGVGGAEDSLPITTPNCNTAAATSVISALQSANKLPGTIQYDFGSGNVPISPITSCRPFEYVRDAALNFVLNYLDFPYDRVGIITFASANPCPESDLCAPYTALRQSIFYGTSLDDTLKTLSIGGTLSYDDADADPDPETITRMEVSSTPPCSGLFKEGLYPNFWDGGAPEAIAGVPDRGDYGECENTDTGDGLKIAFDNLIGNRRGNAVPFIILLSDGAATTSAADAADGAYYACPNHFDADTLDTNGDQIDDDGAPPFYDPYFGNRACQDGDSRNHYIFRHADTDEHYDADDYARDQADAIADAGDIVIFTIGLGAEVIRNPGGGMGCTVDVYGTFPDSNNGNPDCLPNAEQLLRYIADKGDGINPPDADPCERDDDPPIDTSDGVSGAELAANPTYGLYMETIGTENCGNYFYAPSGLNVRKVFEQIAQRIFTRLTK